MTAATETRLPPQVRKQGQAAKDAIADVEKQRAQGSQQTPPVDTPPAQPEGVTQTPPPEQPAPPKIEETEQLRKDLEKSEHRFKTLEGINKAQADENRKMRERLAKLEEKPSAPAATDPERGRKYLKPEEREALGEQTIDTTQRIARGEVEPVADDVKRLEKQIHEQGHRYFLSTLTTKHPEFNTINSDPDWLLWLGQEDRKTGMARQELLDRAVAGQSVERTWAFFEEFIRDTGYKVAEPQPSGPARTPPAAKPAPSAATPPPPAEPSKQKIAHSRIKKFFKDVANRQYSGTEAERKAFTKEIALAEQEGRIDYSR